MVASVVTSTIFTTIVKAVGSPPPRTLFWHGALSKRQSEDSLFAPITHTQCFLRIQTRALQTGVSDCKFAFLCRKITALSCNTWKITSKTLAFITVFLAIINFPLFLKQQ